MEAICKNCSKNFKYRKSSSTGKFCSNECRGNYQFNESKERFKNGLVSERRTIKKILLEINSNCWNCGINTWNNKALALEVDHINGDASNNKLENLQLLCPNCHSQTDSFSGKNLGKGRKSLGLSIR